MKKNNKLIILLFTFIFWPNYSFAYLDPGTGSVILQAILAFFAAVAAYITFAWNTVKKIFLKFFKKKNSSDNLNEK